MHPLRTDQEALFCQNRRQPFAVTTLVSPLILMFVMSNVTLSWKAFHRSIFLWPQFRGTRPPSVSTAVSEV